MAGLTRFSLSFMHNAHPASNGNVFMKRMSENSGTAVILALINNFRYPSLDTIINR